MQVVGRFDAYLCGIALALVCKNSKPGKSRIFHDLWAAELCIWSTENGGNEEQPKPLLGVPWWIPLKEIPHAHADFVELLFKAHVPGKSEVDSQWSGGQYAE